MKKSQKELIIIFCDVAVLCIALFGIYKDFFAPRIGPMGTGNTIGQRMRLIQLLL